LLSSGHINAAQTLLRDLDPTIGGLYCTALGKTLSFPKVEGEKWIQILHDGNDRNGHWLVVASGFHCSDDDRISIYDSLHFRPSEKST
jgi:hypothetical protein